MPSLSAKDFGRTRLRLGIIGKSTEKVDHVAFGLEGNVQRFAEGFGMFMSSVRYIGCGHKRIMMITKNEKVASFGSIKHCNALSLNKAKN